MAKHDDYKYGFEQHFDGEVATIKITMPMIQLRGTTGKFTGKEARRKIVRYTLSAAVGILIANGRPDLANALWALRIKIDKKRDESQKDAN